MAHHNPIKPHPLKPGDTLGIVAPASPFDGDAFSQGTAILHRMGFKTKAAEGLFTRRGYLAGTDKERVSQLHTMLTDDEVQGIICARGGFGSLRIMADLDFGLFQENIKPFIGFSDITALHSILQKNAGWVTFHGPMVTTLPHSNTTSLQSFYDVLTGQGQDQFDMPKARCLVPGSASGMLKGGNLSTLCHLLGTPYACEFSDAILFLEDTGEAPYRIDRMLTQMKLAGAFEGLAGLVLGSFEKCGDADEIETLVQAHFSSQAIPIVSGATAGHGQSNSMLPLGVLARLDAVNKDLEFLEKAFDG